MSILVSKCNVYSSVNKRNIDLGIHTSVNEEKLFKIVLIKDLVTSTCSNSKNHV